jgi:FKBP-type peptidyl-prolyl cis-trans isomerase (trigger factor)
MIEAAVKVEYPPQAVDRETTFVLNQMERNLAMSGLQLDTYLGMIGKTREGYSQELRPAAEDRLQKRLVLEQVAEAEGLEADPDAVEAEIDRLSEAAGEEAEQMRAMLESPEGRLSIASDLVMTQAQERVIQIGKGEIEGEAEVEVEIETEAGVETEAEVEAEAEAEAEAETEVEEEPVAEAGTEEAD